MSQGATLFHEPEDNDRDTPPVQFTQLEPGLTHQLDTTPKSTSPWLCTTENPCLFDKADIVCKRRKEGPGMSGTTMLESRWHQLQHLQMRAEGKEQKEQARCNPKGPLRDPTDREILRKAKGGRERERERESNTPKDSTGLSRPTR